MASDHDPRSPDDETTDGPPPLGERWWWSSTLKIVVGLVVIGYQVSAYASEDGGIWLNAVMIAVGAAVAAWGAVGLWRARPGADGQAGDRSEGPVAD